MRRFKNIIFFFFCFVNGVASYAQNTDEQDSLLIIDSVHQAVDTSFDMDDEESGAGATSPQAGSFWQTDTFAFRKVADSIPADLKKQKAFEYANDPEYWVRKPPAYQADGPGFLEKLARFLARPAVRAFIYILLIALGIFLVVKVILVNNLYIFRSSSKKKRLTGTGDDAGLMEENLDELISQAIASKDQRAAVRFLYLKTLKLLDKKGWIVFHPQTTNYGYRNQVNNYAKGIDFGFLSSVYEHVWYGNFQLNDKQFDIVVHSFNHFQNSLKV